MGQEIPNSASPVGFEDTHKKYKRSQTQFNCNQHYEGILRVATTPFEGCQKVEMDGEFYFMENTKNNLRSLL